jgi:hypothetical protein
MSKERSVLVLLNAVTVTIRYNLTQEREERKVSSESRVVCAELSSLSFPVSTERDQSKLRGSSHSELCESLIACQQLLDGVPLHKLTK